MQRLVIADSHVGQRAGDADAMVALVRKAAAAGYGELVYLGDAFQYLIGMSKFWTRAFRAVRHSWLELRQGGGRIVLIEGNRDFFLDEADLASSIDWNGRCYEFSAGTRRFRLVHGDKVNTRDLQYRFWAAVSKSWPARLWARLLPRPLAVAIVRSMERRLATTNFRFRYVLPVRQLVDQAQAAWAEGVDVILWGHFHELWQLHEGSRSAVVVPPWLSTRQALAVADDGSWAIVDEDLTPCLPAADNGGVPESLSR